MSIRRSTLRSVLIATAIIVCVAIAGGIAGTVVYVRSQHSEPMSHSDAAVQFERARSRFAVTYEDLGHQGPGVIPDATRRGRRVLVWTE